MFSISRDSQPRPTFAQSLIKLWSARYLHFAATRTANALLAYASAARQLAIVYRHCQPARGSRFPGLAPLSSFFSPPRPTILPHVGITLSRRAALSALILAFIYLALAGGRDGKATSASTSVPFYALLLRLAPSSFDTGPRYETSHCEGGLQPRDRV